MKVQSFVLDDPVNSIFHAERAQDTRLLLQLTPYDMRVLAQITAQVAQHPAQGIDPKLAEGSKQAAAMILEFLSEAWRGLTPEEQRMGNEHRITFDD